MDLSKKYIYTIIITQTLDLVYIVTNKANKQSLVNVHNDKTRSGQIWREKKN